MRRLGMFCLAFGIMACGGGGSGSGKESCSQAASQPLSSPCCEALGVDACGAGLFCAAFDGRTQATCYPERSRADRAACTADVQCLSGSCNKEAGACRSMPRAACDVGSGCASDPAGKRWVCVEAVCKQVGDGFVGEICGDGSDCRSDLCVSSRCVMRNCGGGDGRGPCMEAPQELECLGCLSDVFWDCGKEPCADLASDAWDCSNDCHSEWDTEACRERNCEPIFCEYAKCAQKACAQVASCF